MRRHDLRGISDREIDEITAMRIRQYEQLLGHSVTLPVPVENVVERVLGLDFDWTDVDRRRGNTEQALRIVPHSQQPNVIIVLELSDRIPASRP